MRSAPSVISILALLSLGALADAAEPLPSPKGPVVLSVSGNIEQKNNGEEAQFDRAMLEALGQMSYLTGSEVSDKPQLFEGVPLRAILDRVVAHGKAITASALNDYESTIPLEDLKYEPILAMKVDGQVLSVRDKGPLWIIYPRDAHRELFDVKYYSRSVWQLSKLRIE
jgi:hypothetical protein